MSTFSMEHEWEFKPTILRSSLEPGHAPLHTGSEALLLQAVGHIGLIGSVQINRLFDLKRKQIHRMMDERKLVQHVFVKNKNQIPVYTLGPRGAALLQIPYEPNEWQKWRTHKIVQKLVCFQFCCSLKTKGKSFRIFAAESPFTAQVEINGDKRGVLIVRGEIDRLREKLRRLDTMLPIITIAESIEQISPLMPYLKEAKVLLDEDLNTDYRFYRYVDGSWVR